MANLDFGPTEAAETAISRQVWRLGPCVLVLLLLYFFFEVGLAVEAFDLGVVKAVLGALFVDLVLNPEHLEISVFELTRVFRSPDEVVLLLEGKPG